MVPHIHEDTGLFETGRAIDTEEDFGDTLTAFDVGAVTGKLHGFVGVVDEHDGWNSEVGLIGLGEVLVVGLGDVLVGLVRGEFGETGTSFFEEVEVVVEVTLEGAGLIGVVVVSGGFFIGEDGVNPEWEILFDAVDGGFGRNEGVEGGVLAPVIV